MNGPSVSASAGRHEVGLVLPDRHVLHELAVDLGGEGLAHGRVGRLVADVADVEVEPGLGRLPASIGVDELTSSVSTMPLKRTMRHARAVGQRCRCVRRPRRAASGTSGSDFITATVALGLVVLDLRHLGGVVHVAEVGRVDGVLAHLLDARPARVAGCAWGRRTRRRRARARCATSHSGPTSSSGWYQASDEAVALDDRVVRSWARGWCGRCRGCRCWCPRRRTSSRGTGTGSRSRRRCRRGPGGRRGAGRTRPARGRSPSLVAPGTRWRSK